MYTIEEFDKEKIRILKYILYKKRTENEVRRKFESTTEPNLLDDVIDYLKEAKYIDDNDYIDRNVKNFIVLKNLSIREIKQKLMLKGLNKNLIDDYIDKNKEELMEYEVKSAFNIIMKKTSAMELNEIKQFLLKKGYLSENIMKALEE